jgi:hypothetical protein
MPVPSTNQTAPILHTFVGCADLPDADLIVCCETAYATTRNRRGEHQTDGREMPRTTRLKRA